jgi:AcrR family transcriptional regulator/DNA-binding MarR family transcriptional regulator
MVELCAERGAANVTVTHVVARAGVSRRTFYELFDDLADCFQAAFEQAVAQASAVVVAAYSQPGSWREQVRNGLAALLELFDEQPALGALIVVDALGAGSRALERRAALLTTLIDAIDAGRLQARRDSGEAGGPGAGAGRGAGAGPGAEAGPGAGAGPGADGGPSRLIAEGVVGAVLAVLHARLSAREPRSAQSPSLTSLLSQLMSMIVLPYLGPAAARRELARAVPAPAPLTARPRATDPLQDLGIRITYRTIRVLLTIGDRPGESNRRIALAAGVADQGQMSKLLARLQSFGLVENHGRGAARGERNAWTLTPLGDEVERAIRAQTGR